MTNFPGGRACAAMMCLLYSGATWAQQTGFPISPSADRDAFQPHPIGNAGIWFGRDSYPPEAVRAHMEGRSVAEISIDRGGGVTGCKTVSSSGFDVLDRRTCDIAMSRLRFTPAHDRTGGPVAGTYTLPVRWKLEEAAPIALSEPQTALETATVETTIDPEGKFVDCHVVKTPGPVPEYCAQILGTASGRHFTSGGVPVAVKIIYTTSTIVQLMPKP